LVSAGFFHRRTDRDAAGSVLQPRTVGIDQMKWIDWYNSLDKPIRYAQSAARSRRYPHRVDHGGGKAACQPARNRCFIAASCSLCAESPARFRYSKGSL